ncbi:beta-1,4 N-acetylgalactosaminyltransferase 2-like [Glandiceps talaboti]
MKANELFYCIVCFAFGALMTNMVSFHMTRHTVRYDDIKKEWADDTQVRFVFGGKTGDLHHGMFDSDIMMTSSSILENVSREEFSSDSRDNFETKRDEKLFDDALAQNVDETPLGDERINVFQAASLKDLWTQPDEKMILPTESSLRNKMRIDKVCGKCYRTLKHPLDPAMNKRRQREALRWQKEEESRMQPLGNCHAMSPINYIASGIVVEPLQAVRLVGISVDPIAAVLSSEDKNISIIIKSRHKIGKLMLPWQSSFKKILKLVNVSFAGNYTTTLELSSRDVSQINRVLSHVIYKSTFYDIDIRDTVDVTFMHFTVNVRVHIRRHTLPDLYDPGQGGKIADRVTIITKTFERYDAVNRLVESINKFYPNMTIIVADDTEKLDMVLGNNVKQSIMPFAEGLFAGRGVALSQVTTKYLVWVDDDFIFTEKTKLERMLKKLEDPMGRLDLVGGTVNGRPYNKCYVFKYGGESGDCLRTLYGSYRPHERFPECDVTDVVIDFFMAKTAVVRQVGFDPEYKRIGHSEFFIDGLGKMRVASCKDVDVDHVQIRNSKYNLYRSRKDDDTYPRRHTNHLFFNNNLKCT